MCSGFWQGYLQSFHSTIHSNGPCSTVSCKMHEAIQQSINNYLKTRQNFVSQVILETMDACYIVWLTGDWNFHWFLTLPRMDKEQHIRNLAKEVKNFFRNNLCAYQPLRKLLKSLPKTNCSSFIISDGYLEEFSGWTTNSYHGLGAAWFQYLISKV